MEVGNGIMVNEGQQWSFGNHIASSLDEHVKNFSLVSRVQQ
ncbi:hypothetical protein [Bacillus sp. WMMC1349]|nr:hypothetical protein [Bacillus sp. WMMC1349]